MRRNAAMVAQLGANVTVTLVAPFTANIEFTGTLGGTAQTLLEVLPLNPPPGDLTFTLALDKAELLSRLRSAAAVTLPLEVRIQTADAAAVITEQVAFRTALTILRPVIFPDLATVPAIDWLRPPSPQDYIPFSTSSLVIGHQFFRAVVGNGSATSFTLAHGLATSDTVVFGRLNTTGGRQLIHGTDFTVVFTDANQCTVTVLTGAPAAGAWALTVMSEQTVEAFAAGLTVTIGQVTGLDTRLTAIETALAAILALLPTTPVGRTNAGGGLLQIGIPAVSLVFPGGGTAALPPNPPGGLLPALHNATITSLTAEPLPDPATSSGTVLQNNTGADLYVPGGLRTRGSSVVASGFLGSDGRRWYPLSRAGATNSFFPRDFERELFAFEVSAQMLRAGGTLTLAAEVKLQLLKATTKAQYLLVIEHGLAPSQTSPATTSANLQDIVWNATPLLSQRVILSGVQVQHALGVQILRDAGGALTANKTLYGLTTAADAVPASPDMALRARLLNFDTENSVTKAKGAVFVELPALTATISY